MTTHATDTRMTVAAAAEQDTGLTGRVIGTWTVAGAVLMGGFAVAALTLTERISAHGLMLTATGLFLVGAVGGCVAGALLGFGGRPAGVTTVEAARRLGVAAAWTTPFLAVGFVVAGWIATTCMALYVARPLLLAGMALGWAAGLVILAVAALEGWAAARNAVGRAVRGAREIAHPSARNRALPA
jgi:hypothetical protein